MVVTEMDTLKRVSDKRLGMAKYVFKTKNGSLGPSPTPETQFWKYQLQVTSKELSLSKS